MERDYSYSGLVPAAFGAGSPAETAQQPSGLYSLLMGAYHGLGDLAKKAIGSSEMMRQTGMYNPAPMVEAAMLPWGTGAIAGLKMVPGEMALGAGPIRAYHGSPHDFDKFDLSKIGTGEGAQAYGHGLYFAEKEGVAKAYRANNSATANMTYNGKPITDELKRSVAWYLDQAGGDKAAVLDKWRSMYKPASFDHPQFKKELKILEGMDYEKLRPGRMYEVNINADPAHFLDWDKALSRQNVPRNLQETAREYAHQQGWQGSLDDVPGEWLYSALRMKAAPEYSPAIWEASRADATNVLRDANIPGIKYLDQGSRGAGEGSRNYVVFDDKLIDILKKYGLAGMLAAPPALDAANRYSYGNLAPD